MNFLGGSIRIGRLFDITIRVHILFFVLIGYWLVTSGQYWRTELAFCVMLFGTVLVHEFGHCVGARSVGGSAHDILMWPLGGLAYAHAPMRPWPQFVTVACGPLVNVVFCVVSAAVLIIATGAFGVVSLNPLGGPGHEYMTATWQLYVWLFYRINLLLLCFNLLPVFPLDGGQLFRSIVWPFVGLQRATVLAAQLGIVGAIFLGVWGATEGHFMLIAIAIFGGMTSFQHLQAARQGMIVEDDRFTAHTLREQSRAKGLWARLFGGRRVKRSRPNEPRPSVNPNPGGWEAKIEERDRVEAELDRILRKVHEQGVNSLSYTERQTLERATRERQKREREFERDTKL